MSANLSLATLGELDNGAARAIIDSAINRAIDDIDDRGDDEKPRKVVITIELEKLENGLVSARVDAKTNVPAYQTAATFAKISKRQGEIGLLFQPFNPERPDQPTLLETKEGDE